LKCDVSQRKREKREKREKEERGGSMNGRAKYAV